MKEIAEINPHLSSAVKVQADVAIPEVLFTVLHGYKRYKLIRTEAVNNPSMNRFWKFS
jgi:hypothetical protein